MIFKKPVNPVMLKKVCLATVPPERIKPSLIARRRLPKDRKSGKYCEQRRSSTTRHGAFAQDELDDAVAAYLRALEDDPNYADALHALAMTYAHQEKVDQAIEIGKRLIEVGAGR